MKNLLHFWSEDVVSDKSFDKINVGLIPVLRFWSIWTIYVVFLFEFFVKDRVYLVNMLFLLLRKGFD